MKTETIKAEGQTGGKRLVGVVTSDKMNKTRVVSVAWKAPHPLYGKIMSKITKLQAHDEHNLSKTGDTVLIQETKPISKEKRWKILELIEKKGA